MSGPKAQTAPSRELILANHEFPGEYMIKAFGPGGRGFYERVVACAHAVVDAERVAPSQRSTRSGAKICVTLTLHVERVEEIEAIYAEIHALDDLMLIL
ncbi:MAG: DUF493 domain-containing protein [Myxococcales bacterium]|nr:DUF493 domain-containing protein [Myxococcales bacterium]